MQPDPIAVEFPRTYRNPALRQNAILFPVLLLLAALAIGAQVRTLAAWGLLAIAWVVLAGWLASEFLRLRVVADHDGLLVVNYLSTQRIPWTRIRSIGDAPHFNRKGTIELVDGRRVRARALGVVGTAQGAPYVMKACWDLEAIRSAQLARTGATPAGPDR